MGPEGNQHIDFGKLNAAQLAHNFLQQTRGGNYTVDELNQLNQYLQFVLDAKNRDIKRQKVGLMFVCINPNYWQYIHQVVQDAKTFFLPGHDVEIMVWSDVPKSKSKEAKAMIDAAPAYAELENDPERDKKISKEYLEYQINAISALDVTVFPVESAPWPYPTLMRYHFFLQQEEYLKKFDHIFYLDLDMRIVNVVGDEILGDGLTMAQHPMYALRQEFWYPYEPNPDSSAYIRTPGRIINNDGKPMFQPLYAAGGVQGGTTDTFIEAMKEMKKTTDADFSRNYVARWNDESHWNRYLYDHPPAVVLNPSYVYPDSMVNEYYVKLWGRNYPPKIITLTKPFTVSKEGGDAAKRMTETL